VALLIESGMLTDDQQAVADLRKSFERAVAAATE